MKKTAIILICLAMLVTLLGACAAGDDADSSAGSEAVMESGDTAKASAVYTAINMNALKDIVPASDGDVAVLRGYWLSGDGGGGTFYWDASSEKDDDGGTVIAPRGVESGRFIRVCEENYRNVKWFGATGAGSGDDGKAIQAAIDSLPAAGGTVSLPAGTYNVMSTINIGDGDGGSRFSTRNGVKLVGEGGGFGVSGTLVPTTIIAGAKMDRVISVNGRVSDIKLSGLSVNCALKADTGIYLGSFTGSVVSNVKVQAFTGTGISIMAGSSPTGNYNIENRFETVFVISLVDNTECLRMDGDYSTNNDTWLSVFTDCRFDTNKARDSVAAHFKFVDSISFYRCHFNTYDDSSTGIVFDALDNNDFPCGMAFYDCSIVSNKVLEDDDHHIRMNYFYGFGTYDNEAIPEHNMLAGITDMGIPFHMDALGGGGMGGGTQLSGKKGTFDLYSNGEYVPINLSETKSEIGIRFSSAGSFAGGTFYLPNYSDGNDIGTVKLRIYKWDTDYDTTVAGGEVYSTQFVNFVDNSWQKFETGGLDAGEYLAVLTGTTEPGDYGVGVWTKAKTGGIVTYRDGAEADFGVVGQFTVK